jgi:hypothetical protein
MIIATILTAGLWGWLFIALGWWWGLVGLVVYLCVPWWRWVANPELDPSREIEFLKPRARE